MPKKTVEPDPSENSLFCPFPECRFCVAPLSRKDFEYHLINKHGIQKDKVSDFIMDHLDQVFSPEKTLEEINNEYLRNRRTHNALRD